MEKRTIPLTLALFGAGAQVAWAQLDPYPRNLLQLGYDLSLSDQGPQALYAYYYYNNPTFLRTNMTLRLAVAPIYLDGELGFRGLISPQTDLGIGLSGGGFSENYYEIRKGDYIKRESFDGHGGGTSLNLYHLLNPGQKIPLNAVVQGGFHYSTFGRTGETADDFEPPENRESAFVRAGLRFAGKEPLLYPDLGMEVSVWYQRDWRFNSSEFGYADDPRRVEAATDIYWLYAGLNYAWTNIGHKITFSFTAGGSDQADRFSAWRLGGVLPLATEFPLTLPGYYYQELSARRFVHFSAGYGFPLTPSYRWKAGFSVATACLDYLPDFKQASPWQTGVGADLSYTSRNEVWRVIGRYGYAIDAVREGHDGAHSIGLLVQYNFEQRKKAHAAVQ